MHEDDQVGLDLQAVAQQFLTPALLLGGGSLDGSQRLQLLVEVLQAAKQLGVVIAVGWLLPQARGQVVPDTAAETLFETLPGVSRLAIAGQQGSEGGQR
jgi:hypothetical protein